MSDLFKQIQKNKKPPQIPQKGEDSGSDDEEENKDNFVADPKEKPNMQIPIKPTESFQKKEEFSMPKIPKKKLWSSRME